MGIFDNGIFGSANMGGANAGGIFAGMEQAKPNTWDIISQVASGLQDANAAARGQKGGYLDANLQDMQLQRAQKVRQALMAGLNSEDPAARQKAYSAAAMLGINTKPIQDQRASAALPGLIQSMQPHTENVAQTAPVSLPNLPGQSVQGGGFSFEAPGLNPTEALTQSNSPELQSMYLPKLMEQAFAGPMKIGKDERLYSPNDFSKPLVDVAPEPVDFNKAFMPDGTPNKAFQDYSLRNRAAGRPQMSVNVSADRSFGTQLGENAGKILDASHAAAAGGIQTINTVAQIKDALSTGKVTAGPGATAVQFFNQVAGGDPEKVTATRKTIQGLAQLTMAGRSALKGQGQISDYEGKLLAKASSGDIDSMTVGEIATVAEVADRNARISIRLNRGNVDKARKAAPGNQDLIDFYNVDEPAPYAAPSKSSVGTDGWGQPRVKR